MVLFKPQIPHAHKLLDSIYKNGFAKDLSQTGTGKTPVASWIAKQLNCPVVVICPKGGVSMWKQVLEAFGVYNVTCCGYEELTRGNSDWLQYDLNKFHSTPKWWESQGIELTFSQDSFVIIDEEHKCGGLTSLAGDLLTAVANKQYKCLGLSATAATSVLNMKAFGYAAKLHNGENYKTWCLEHGAKYNEFGSLSWDGDMSDAQEGMRKIHNRLFNETKVASRMLRKDFGDIFPENRISSELFDMGVNNRKIQLAYEQMEAEMASLDARAINYKDHKFAIMMEHRRRVELLKVPTIVSWITDAFDEGISPVTFLNFSDSINAVHDRLPAKYKKHFASIVGGQKDRDREIEDFQANKRRIMLVNSKAGGELVSLQDLDGNFPRHSLLNPSWSAVLIIQCLGRIFRANGKSPCIQRFLYANNPIESRMASRLDARSNNLDCLNDGELDPFGFTYVVTE